MTDQPKTEETVQDNRPKPVKREGLRQERIRTGMPDPPLIQEEKKRLQKLREEKPEHWTAKAARRREREAKREARERARRV